MRRKHTTAWLCWIWLPAALGCGTIVEDPHVDYGNAKPLGSWSAATAQTTFETEGLEAAPQRAAAGSPASAPATAAPATTRPSGPSPISGGTAIPAAGTPASGSAGAAAADSGAPRAPAGAAGAAAPSGAGEVEPDTTAPEAAGVTKLEFSYTTQSLGGRYSPKNVGAVWVTDSAGKLVKSLEVWARVRLRYLLSYAAARGSARPDVTATATLTNHKAHTATWDLMGTMGAALPPGKYTLHAEVTDSHMDGKTISVPFDTSAGAVTIEPPDSPGFTGVKLVLQ